jgi:methyltransferase-like protein/2-polyprenyl-3-methyl-5-hydroxy-6-metoxy-1,4-benzoquinol methylase
MSETQLTSYDDVPYISRPHYPTHPDCLATVARLMGMKTAAVDQCRVLELGCASGGNLIPMAVSLPKSQFVGIDLSPRQVTDGQAIVDSLGLANIDLRPLSILDIDDDFGQFDYIICHGVYSWVPPVVQDKILEVCNRNLAPNGVAYVSYNTYPGWHARGMVREMLNFHVRKFEEPAVRVQQARAFLEFLAKSTADPAGAYARVLREEAELIRPGADYYLFHEHLEDVNEPLYFHQFAERFAAKRLQYLGEAWFHTNLSKYPSEVQETLQGLSSDLVVLEQYIDFLENRTFRRTLVCHDQIHLDRAPSAKTVAGLCVSAAARPVSEQPEIASMSVEEFKGDDGANVSTNMPLIKAALMALFEAWPKSLKFDDLWSAVRGRLQGMDGSAVHRSPEMLAETLLACYMSNLAALHVKPFDMVTEVGDRPVASPLARHQSAAGMPIANLRHRVVDVSDGDRFVLGYLDGNHDRSAIVSALGRAIGNGTLKIDDDAAGEPVAAVSERPPSADGARSRQEFLAGWLEASLYRLARSSLLLQ